LKTADQVERLLIQELRRLGKTSMHEWATQAEERVSRELKDQDAVLSENSSALHSRGLPVIVLEQPTEPFSTLDGPDSGQGRELRPENLVAQALVVAFMMVMQNELPDSVPQAGLLHKHHPVKTTLLDCPDKSLSIGI
jgi:hypothetical protein